MSLPTYYIRNELFLDAVSKRRGGGSQRTWVVINDERKFNVAVARKHDDLLWWIVNVGMDFEEGPFDTAEKAVVYCNLMYSPVDKETL